VRTLVISDLHLGSRLERDVLRRPAALDGLLRALDDADRLVLLGDTVELAESRSRHALAVAEPILRAIGARLGPGREVVLVPGNHDLALIRPHVRADGVPEEVDAVLTPRAATTLERVVAWLGPARVSVRYPGVWLAPGVWATHGHYLDRHLVPDSAYGITRGRLGRRPADRVLPRDYEHGRRPSLTRAEALLTSVLPRPLAVLADDVAELLRAASMPQVAGRLRGRRLSRLTARLLGLQMQRASIPAIAHVAHRLGVDADYVIFGHVHRLGPLPPDPPGRWTGPDGRPRIVNTGSWVYEELLLHHAGPPHPYWPGGAVVVEDGRPPRAVGLLDHLTAL
jgi:UDP-2,3-diacylglucosamine pyrophosphatase LpxH